MASKLEDENWVRSIFASPIVAKIREQAVRKRGTLAFTLRHKTTVKPMEAKPITESCLKCTNYFLKETNTI